MKFVTDLHLHSKYSRAVSKDMILPNMAHWARLKGIDILATGDWTHPAWLAELQQSLIASDDHPGFFTLRPEMLSQTRNNTDVKQTSTEKPVYFLLSCEISSIYSQGGKLRRIHDLIFVPNLEAAQKINQKLLEKGAKLSSDGRPIVGLSARNLAELVLSVEENALIIPAHIWTPWFSLFGSESGFDALKECFLDMANYIYAVETGLSSDPAMNWRIEELDSRQILSFSDAHSLPKFGREATVFEGELSYFSILNALKNPTDNEKVTFTIEFFPEEGKYHYTGHRNCNVKHSPKDTEKLGTICPVCGRGLTVGVMHRVHHLAKRSEDDLEIYKDDRGMIRSRKLERPPYKMLVPLEEILAESLGVQVGTKKVLDLYYFLAGRFGSEIEVLLNINLEEIGKVASERVVEGIKRVREGNIFVDPGFDGVYGQVSIWPKEEEKVGQEQMGLFV